MGENPYLKLKNTVNNKLLNFFNTKKNLKNIYFGKVASLKNELCYCKKNTEKYVFHKYIKKYKTPNIYKVPFNYLIEAITFNLKSKFYPFNYLNDLINIKIDLTERTLDCHLIDYKTHINKNKKL